jgi:hypothetical protein
VIAHWLLLALVPVAVRAGDAVEVSNPAPVAVDAVRVGPALVGRLEAGERRVVASPEATIAGRFAVEDWPRALDVCDPADPDWAPWHLRTAGALPDAADPGIAGAPDSGGNRRALARADQAALAAAVHGPARRLVLLAEAARHVPAGPLLARLLATVSPGDGAPVGPGQMSPAEALRRTIEERGAEAVPLLLESPAWAADRGFAVPGLARALVEGRTGSAPHEDETVAGVAAALAAGRFDDAAAAAVPLALAWRPDPSQAGTLCAALDVGAQRATQAERTTAAEAWLRLAAPACGPTAAFRERAARVWRRRGDAAFADGDLEAAIGWYRAAFFTGRSGLDRERLGVALARMAALQPAGSPLAERWSVESAALGTSGVRTLRLDGRARIALTLLIVVLSVFAFRQLRRALRGA